MRSSYSRRGIRTLCPKCSSIPFIKLIEPSTILIQCKCSYTKTTSLEDYLNNDLSKVEGDYCPYCDQMIQHEWKHYSDTKHFCLLNKFPIEKCKDHNVITTHYCIECKKHIVKNAKKNIKKSIM